MLRPALLLVLLLPAGCVLPLQFEEERDGGLDRNYPPIILASTPAMPGFTSIDTSQLNPDIYSLDLEDKDIGDRLYVR